MTKTFTPEQIKQYHEAKKAALATVQTLRDLMQRLCSDSDVSQELANFDALVAAEKELRQ